MAPELYLQQYKGEQVDLFAASVVFFIMLTGHPPFNEAQPSDSYYAALMNGQHNTFWESHSVHKPKNFWSKELKDLFNHMFSYNPLNRLTLAELKSHPVL